MIIDFGKLQEIAITHLNDGDGNVLTKMFRDSRNKIMVSRLPVGASIGIHEHQTSSEVNYVISGTGKAICDEIEEDLFVGCCQYCPKGHSHSILNTGTEDLVLFTVVPEQ